MSSRGSIEGLSMGQLPGKQSTKWLNIQEVAALCDLSVATVRYRIGIGVFSGPRADGLFDRAVVLKEMEKAPKARGGRPLTKLIAQTESRSRAEQRRPSSGRHIPTETMVEAELRFRKIKADQEALKLEKMRGDLIEVVVVSRRVFAMFRLIRDRLGAWVSRTAPILAGLFKIDEGGVWRALQEEMRKLEAELSGLDLERLLATEGEGDDDGAKEDGGDDAASAHERKDEPHKAGRVGSGARKSVRGKAGDSDDDA